MKSHQMQSNFKKAGVRGGAKTTQQAVSELKQRVGLALNKLADRDTHQIGAEELGKLAAELTSEGIGAFLSCVVDSDSEQKSSVRKECVRVMGTLARFHGQMLVPYVGRMVGSIVKRLKDSDSVVRDACIETCGVLVSSGSDGGGIVFIGIAKPLFEALGEQNRYVQMGSALCLARVIDEANDPPVLLLTQMLTRIVKLIKNPHFMAKPAVIELIRSIIQAGGASTERALSAAVTSILETLKSSDWTTRKAASVALAGIAVFAGPLLGSLKSPCIRSLESCRFDKVKPVRDTILHTLHCWKTLPGTGSPKPSEAGSSCKENINGDNADVSGSSDGGWRERSFRKAGPLSGPNSTSSSTSKKKIPSTAQKSYPNYVQIQHPSSNDWHVEISLPKAHTSPSINNHLTEFGGSCGFMASERVPDSNKGQDVKYDYDPAEDQVEDSCMSEVISGSFETKHVTLDEGNSPNSVGIDHISLAEEVDPECSRMQERKSIESTITDTNSHGCCSHAANELALIRKQLFEIETKQSNLLDLLQIFVGNSVDNLSTLQLKVHNLEHAVDKITREISLNGKSSGIASSKYMKNTQSVNSSPRFSTSTPKLSVESNHKQSSLTSSNNKEMWGDNKSSRSRSSTSVKESLELWTDPTLNIIRNPIAKVTRIDSKRSALNSGSNQMRETRSSMLSVSDCNASSAKQCNIDMESKNGFWKQIKELLYAGDVESAYAEALYSGDDLCLIELMDRTGPVLERLSSETTGLILSILTTNFLNQRFIESIIPWFLQVVDLSSTRGHGNLAMSSKARMEFLYALREAAGMECIDPADRVALTDCVAKLSQLWGEALSRKTLAARGSRGSKTFVPLTRI